MIKSILSFFVIVAILLGFVSINSRFDQLQLEAEKVGDVNESPVPEEEPSASVDLVWSEDFENCELYSTKDEENEKTVYYTDNYSCLFVSYGMNSSASLYEVQENTDLLLRINNEKNYEKSCLKVGYDFSEILNKEKLELSKSKFIALKFSFEHQVSPSEDITQYGDVYFRYTVSSENGKDLSVISNSLKYSQNSIGGYTGGAYDPVTIVALIHVDERMDYSDLYFYIDNFGQYVVFEDFLKYDSCYVSSFEMCFDNLGIWSSYYVDDFELYTFGAGYEGSIRDALKEINFIQ